MPDSERKKTFLNLRKKFIESRFKKLNPEQRKAVLSVKGPLLILAGAGSGKTTVLINRIQNLIEFGDAYESNEISDGITDADIDSLKELLVSGKEPSAGMRKLLKTGNIMPWNILAITFTNKAADELKKRISDAVGADSNEVFASTFHSACVRFLRRNSDAAGISNNFDIYDTDDSQRVMKDILKSRGIDSKFISPKAVLSVISRAKDEMNSPDDLRVAASSAREELFATLYHDYQLRLKNSNALDFDDLIYFTVRLLENNPEVKSYYNNRFKYIHVDEYQDTSYAQFRLIYLLTGKEGNICVVGDDDQSIYKFRGATIENILGFEERFPGSRVMKLEQNYRSTSSILNAANRVISNNVGRKGKVLWTDNEDGDLITVYKGERENDEAAFIASKIWENNKKGIPYNAHAILYRMNAQSKIFENYFIRAGIPYVVMGSLRFLDRAEIKDILSYMSILNNPYDDLRLKRVINVPARKIGQRTVENIENIASGLGIPMLEVIANASDFPILERSLKPLKEFYGLYERLAECAADKSISDLLTYVLEETGYLDMLKADGEKGQVRIENVGELMSSVKIFEDEQPEASLNDFLTDMFLASDLDNYSEENDAVVMMTLHNSKGLEFDIVFMPGMEEGIFPGDASRYDEKEIEEERRLCYVGMTRARKQLYLIFAEMRMLFGMTRRNPVSRFIEEIPEEMTNSINTGEKFLTARQKREREERRDPAILKTSITTHSIDKKRSTKKIFKGGDRIIHKVFGRGIILKATEIGDDILLEIDFDDFGKKKAMANYAPIQLDK